MEEKMKIAVHNQIVIPFHRPSNRVMLVNIINCIKQIEIYKTKLYRIYIAPFTYVRFLKAKVT